MEEKVKLHLDTIGYKEKPTNDDMAIIKNRVQRASPPVEVTVKELIEAIQEGKAVSPAVMKGTKAKDFVEQQVFPIDIDNNITEKPILQVEEALSIKKKNHLPLAFYYFSYSNKKEIPKYPFLFIIYLLMKFLLKEFVVLVEQFLLFQLPFLRHHLLHILQQIVSPL